MQLEVFPPRASFLNAWTRQELQLGDTCTCFGWSSSTEAMAHRAGYNIQISPYFNYYYMDKQHVSIEESIRTANRVGYCPDSFYPVTSLPLYPPSLEALTYASYHKDGFAIKRVNGRKELMRAICTGSPLITQRWGVTMEHVECCIGYDIDRGFQIQGSGMMTDYWPWPELPLFTQLYKFTRSPFPFIPFPGYIPSSHPLFDSGTLEIPTLGVYTDWQTPVAELNYVTANISTIGEVTIGNEIGEDPLWKEATRELHLPSLQLGQDGDVYYGVIVKDVVWKYTGTPA